jgi:tRNA-modifying protein YgfZ
MSTTALRATIRAREFVAVTGPDAPTFLQRMVSNDVEVLAPGESCQSLLLTAKGRLIAPLVVLRRSHDDFLLLTEVGLGERVRSTLLRARFAAKCALEPEEHVSTLVLGGTGGVANHDYGVPAVEVLDQPAPESAAVIGGDELERLRILARSPQWGHELDERVLPAEAGLEERAISFTKGCYPGQEPIARLHYRGHPNRELRVVSIEGVELPSYDAALELEGKAVGRLTSAVRDADGVLGLAYVRREVPYDAVLLLAGRAVAPHSPRS